MAQNLVTKILDDHIVEGVLDPGEEVGLRIDQTLLQDATGTMACSSRGWAWIASR